MKRYIVAALLALSQIAGAYGQTPLEARIEELLKFDNLVTHLPIPKDRPTIVYRTSCELGAMNTDMKSNPTAKDCNPMKVMGVAANGVIFLLDTFKLGDDDAILAHELVHFMQWADAKYHDIDGVSREVTDDMCVAELEPEAYHAQDVLTAAQGHGWKSDEFTVISMVSACRGQ